jgi:hypothetical protein
MAKAPVTDLAEHKARGRKDKEGQESVIQMQPVKDNLQNLVDLWNKAKESNARLNDAVKATAEKSGLLASVVRRLVNAKAGEKYDEEANKVQQLALVFEEVGTPHEISDAVAK